VTREYYVGRYMTAKFILLAQHRSPRPHQQSGDVMRGMSMSSAS
jgi:hypothetical protein